MPASELLKGLGELLPAIRARRAEIEEARRMPRDLVDALAGAGVFALSVPRDIGGREAAPPDILETIETVAAADGSTGWCTMIGVGNNVVSGYMDKAGSKEVFANPTRPSAGIAGPAGTAVRTDGGVRVSGRWPFASGITHCDWLWAGCIVLQDGQPRMTPTGPEIVHVCMPVSDAQIHDTWFVSGLAGTGSNDFSVADVFVPSQRIFALLDPARHRPEPLYRMPPLGWFVSQVASVSLGIARGALDEFLDLAQNKAPTLSTAVLADKPATQIETARAEAQLAAARALLYGSVEALWDTVVAGREPTPRQIALNRVAALNAAETGAAVTRMVHMHAGGSSVYRKTPLQRHMRDAEAITHHFTVSPHVWEDAGRVFMGRQPIAPMF